MRTIVNINRGWKFTKEPMEAKELMAPKDIVWDLVELPHCWNAVDGQDGGGDYYRGRCWYVKEIVVAELPRAACCYLEIRGANSSADVYADGEHLAHHDGGYSTWRVNMTSAFRGKDRVLLAIAVDNSANDTVYPQMADFTFYGGLYRDVNLICVEESHFDLDYYGGLGVRVTPVVEIREQAENGRIMAADARVTAEVYLTGAKPGQQLRYTVKDVCGTVVAMWTGEETKAEMMIEAVKLWHGRKSPYLYTLQVELLGAEDNGEPLDTVSVRFGCRTYEIHPERGFILNGEEYPLRGVSRHQDRWGLGNALLPKHHREDMELIHEVGATTIRLAHYQHDPYFYDLCDEYGMVVWAEIPYISRHMPTGRANTISQMKELIVQNYNHPSIVVWGLSNEITMNGAGDKDLLENHHILNDLAHRMDPTRLTTMAVISMCDPGEDYVHIPDVVSYNHYFGWYGGTTDMNGPWFDRFHAAYPQKPIGVSEYGCEALNWHSSQPKQGDYTEEYQAYYHEELIKQLFSRKYLWATHVWNMFDFGADARNEGGENGQNHKGLVTFDRSYKKDSFYAYKAWLSDEPFVHLCGKRYVDRVENVTKVTVYSNQPRVELFVNDQSLGIQESAEHFFYFQVPNEGETRLVAVAGDCQDESVIRKVDQMNPDYILKEKGAILNWFDVTTREGYYCLNDTMGEIMETFRGKILLLQFCLGLMRSMKQVGKDEKNGKKKGGAVGNGIKLNKNVLDMVGGFTILRASNMVGMVGATVTKEQLLRLNTKLNKIRKKSVS